MGEARGTRRDEGKSAAGRGAVAPIFAQGRGARATRRRAFGSAGQEAPKNVVYFGS